MKRQGVKDKQDDLDDLPISLVVYIVLGLLAIMAGAAIYVFPMRQHPLFAVLLGCGEVMTARRFMATEVRRERDLTKAREASYSKSREREARLAFTIPSIKRNPWQNSSSTPKRPHSSSSICRMPFSA